MAPTSSTLLSALLGSQPSICTSISVFSRRLASCSPVTPHTHCSLVQPKIFASFRSLASAACLLHVSFRNLCCLPQQLVMLLHGVTLLACRHFSQICPVWSCQELVLHIPSPSSARKCKHCCCFDCSCGGLGCHQVTSTHAMKLLFDLLCCQFISLMP